MKHNSLRVFPQVSILNFPKNRDQDVFFETNPEIIPNHAAGEFIESMFHQLNA